jgi:acyl-CoA synthetase (AMP-forming)/AMP-acid ligase II
MIVRSPYPDVEIPKCSFPEHVFRRAAEWGDKPALIDGASNRIMSFRQLDDSVRRAASGLVSLGVRRGDVVALYAPNVPDYAVAVHAVLRLGGICTTINPQYTVDELAHQLEDARARCLVTVGASLEKAKEASQRVGLESLLTFDEHPDVMPFGRLLEAEPIGDDYRHPEHTSLAVLPYSSGTTGHPKGVMLTHLNLVANMAQYDGCLDVDRPTAEDTIIAVLPFFHIYGFRLYLGSALSHGATLVTLPRFEIDMFLRAIEEFQVTLLYTVPPILLAIVKFRGATDYDLSSLRHIVCGAAPLDEGLASAAVDRLNCTFVQAYGLTETSPMTHCGRCRGMFAGKVGSAGVCAPNTEAKVIDCETGLELGMRQPGELLVRGPQVMQG